LEDDDGSTKMDVDRHEEGVPYWVALEAQDPEKVASFYGGLFGWAPPEERPDPDGFLVSLRRGALVASFHARDGIARPTWRTYVYVADVAAATRKVTEAGGSVLTPPNQVGSVGRMAVFADPAGAVLGAWQPVEGRGAVVVNEPGAYVWGELISDDADVSAAFYRSAFGWELAEPSPDDASGRREWMQGGRTIGGLLPRPPTMPTEIPPYWDVYFAVEDPAATVAEATRLGGTVLLPPLDIAHGRIAVFADPAGAVFSVIAPTHLPS
jgi:uncharacterized protein